MKTKRMTTTVRRSVALPRRLVQEASALAPPDLRHNLNRLVTVALQEFAARHKVREFEVVVAEMARDPAIQAECASIAKAFGIADADGLRG